MILENQTIVIVIIDDDRDDQEIFQEALYEVNPSIKCIAASSCEDGLSLLEENIDQLPDYIFLDLNMPRMNGKQCLKFLKDSERLRAIPVIIYTTSYLQKDKEETASLGAAHFLTKPVSINELKKEIVSVLTSPLSR